MASKSVPTNTRRRSGVALWSAPAVAAILLWSLPQARAAEPAGTAVEPTGIAVSESDKGAEARTEIDGCVARLEYRPGQKAAHYRDACRRPTAAKAETMMALLGAVLDREQTGSAEATGSDRLVVYSGRIVQTFPDMAAELATTAARTSGWNADAARRSSPYANAAVAQLLARTDGGRALREAPAPHGYRVSGFAVEKVLIAQPRRLPFPLPPHVVSANADTELPFDAQLWIALRRD